MARPGDPNGFYARLGIAVWATQPAIGATFCARPRELDRRPPPIPVVPRLERRVVTGSGVDLRLGPGTEHPPITPIARGDLVELLPPEIEGWAYVRLGDGRHGYIAARLLTAP